MEDSFFYSNNLKRCYEVTGLGYFGIVKAIQEENPSEKVIYDFSR